MVSRVLALGFVGVRVEVVYQVRVGVCVRHIIRRCMKCMQGFCSSSREMVAHSVPANELRHGFVHRGSCGLLEEQNP